MATALLSVPSSEGLQWDGATVAEAGWSVLTGKGGRRGDRGGARKG